MGEVVFVLQVELLHTAGLKHPHALTKIRPTWQSDTHLVHYEVLTMGFILLLLYKQFLILSLSCRLQACPNSIGENYVLCSHSSQKCPTTDFVFLPHVSATEQYV